MYCREPAGIIRVHQDACAGCDRFIGGETVCRKMGNILREALVLGMHLDVVYCPEHRPPLGKEKG